MSAEYGADRTLWQGELPTESWMSEEYLKSLWLQFGEQVNVKLIRDKHTG